MSTKPVAPAAEMFTLNLDPKVPLAEQVRLGNYDYANPAFTTPGNFSLTLPAGKREVILYDPHGSVSSEEMIRRMKAEHCIPATLDDALAMGIQFPERQRTNPIVFLGTIWCDGIGLRHVPVLNFWYGRRELNLSWFDDVWDDNAHGRFAAVRES